MTKNLDTKKVTKSWGGPVCIERIDEFIRRFDEVLSDSTLADEVHH